MGDDTEPEDAAAEAVAEIDALMHAAFVMARENDIPIVFVRCPRDGLDEPARIGTHASGMNTIAAFANIIEQWAPDERIAAIAATVSRVLEDKPELSRDIVELLKKHINS